MTGAGFHKLFSLQAPKSTYTEILGEEKTNILEIFSNTTQTKKLDYMQSVRVGALGWV